MDAYCARIGYFGPREPALETLRALHLAHITHIPFENVDVLLRIPVSLDLNDLQAKLIRARRGGYCFEHNLLFAAVLKQVGFEVTRLAARVRLGAHRNLPRTHLLLLVKLNGVPWIADVGFGGWGLLEPIPLEAGREVRQFQWSFRLQRGGDEWVLQCPQCRLGEDQYSFTLEPQLSVDCEMANFYCANHPQSPFVQSLVVQLAAPTQRLMLRDHELRVDTPADSRAELFDTNDRVLRVLAERFGLRLPPGTILTAAHQEEQPSARTA